jgi:hypothetical protein
MVGLIGTGVGASFFDQITANAEVNVGTFSCGITTATPGATFGNIDGLGYAHTVSYTAPEITSSAAGSAPFSFTVKSTGSIPATFHATRTTPAAPFTAIGNVPADVSPGVGGTHVYNGGLQWPVLTNSELGMTASITYTVSCGEVAPVLPNVNIPSTNAINQTNGWANVTWETSVGAVALTFHQPRAFFSCFEYRTDGDMSQKISDTNPNTDVHDGYYPHVCLNTAGSSSTVNLGPTIGYVEFRMVFGAETDERFDWTRVDALP